MHGDEWQQEYLGIPVFPSACDRAIQHLVSEYERITEEFDQQVCRHRRPDGTAQPVTAYERSACNRNAYRVYCELRGQALGMGYTRRDWEDARMLYRINEPRRKEGDRPPDAAPGEPGAG